MESETSGSSSTNNTRQIAEVVAGTRKDYHKRGEMQFGRFRGIPQPIRLRDVTAIVRRIPAKKSLDLRRDLFG